RIVWDGSEVGSVGLFPFTQDHTHGGGCCWFLKMESLRFLCSSESHCRYRLRCLNSSRRIDLIRGVAGAMIVEVGTCEKMEHWDLGNIECHVIARPITISTARAGEVARGAFFEYDFLPFGSRVCSKRNQVVAFHSSNHIEIQHGFRLDSGFFK